VNGKPMCQIALWNAVSTSSSAVMLYTSGLNGKGNALFSASSAAGPYQMIDIDDASLNTSGGAVMGTDGQNLLIAALQSGSGEVQLGRYNKTTGAALGSVAKVSNKSNAVPVSVVATSDRVGVALLGAGGAVTVFARHPDGSPFVKPGLVAGDKKNLQDPALIASGSELKILYLALDSDSGFPQVWASDIKCQP